MIDCPSAKSLARKLYYFFHLGAGAGKDQLKFVPCNCSGVNQAGLLGSFSRMVPVHPSHRVSFVVSTLTVRDLFPTTRYEPTSLRGVRTALLRL